jgi:glutamate racemase
VIVFGCTHYLYIKENIKKILKNVKFIDWNIWIAKQIKKVLSENNLLNNSNIKGSLIEYDTKNFWN